MNLQSQIDVLGTPALERVSRLVDCILSDAVLRNASDVHFEPTHAALEIRYRLDGVLQPAAVLNRDLTPNIIARLKVMSELLTYRIDVPQEGALGKDHGNWGAEMRVSTFPIIHGEKAVVRIFPAAIQALDLEQLGIPADLQAALGGLLQERTGAVLLTGPSGSGKTTTIYACLRRLVRLDQGRRHVVTIEDPVEQVIEGVSQSQARPGTEFDFARGLRSLLRQDPEVIMIGEIRDRETAATAIEAALTGHLVFSTLHAGSACGVVGRLLEMGVEPYLLTSGLKGILNQRLVRKLCPECRQPIKGSGGYSQGQALGCASCAGAGYRGRMLLAELLIPDSPMRQAILNRSDTSALEAAVQRPDRQTIWTAADRAIAQGLTTASEIERVLGPRPEPLAN